LIFRFSLFIRLLLWGKDCADKEKLMSKRPMSITLIAWLLIAVGSYFLIIDFNKLPAIKEMLYVEPARLAQLFFNYIKMIVPLSAGIAMLNRRNWGRYLYLFFWISNFIIFWIRSIALTNGAAGGMILFLITVFFLFRPPANDYFSGKKPISPQAQT